jgi:hypothetical protein
MGETESVAMWRVYARDLKGIAVRSTVGRIRSQMPENGKIRQVKFIDYGIDKTLDLSPVYCKRRPFEYEREVRAVVPLDTSPAPVGLPLRVDLNSVITEIRLSPAMPSWMADLAQALLFRYGVNVECFASELDSSPQFDWELSGE